MKPITDDQLNLMFNNFAKISQWLSKGKEAKYPLPPIFETIFSEIEELRINFNLFSAEIETLKNEVAEVKNQIKPLDNTAQEDIGDSLQAEPETQTELEATADSMPETIQAEPETQTNFTMEEVETGEINEEAFIELDKQLNNLLAE